MISKWTAKRLTGARVIERPANSTETWLFETVKRQARRAGIGTSEVATYDSLDMNAFATGMRRNHALVAVSTGFLQSMGQDEVEAVLAHEVTHVANGDMITLVLIQEVVNTFVVFCRAPSVILLIARYSRLSVGMAPYFGLQPSSPSWY